MYTAEHFSVVENNLYGYADDSTLVAVVSSPGESVAVSGSMNRDLNRVSVWCNLWGMKLNASKTKTMIVFDIHVHDYDIHVTHSSSSVNPIDSRWNCDEGVC